MDNGRMRIIGFILLLTILIGSTTIVALNKKPEKPTATHSAPFYALQYVDEANYDIAESMNINVILIDFDHDGSPQEWTAALDTAQAHNLQVIAWQWTPGWQWNGTNWTIDSQAELFLETVENHPALFAVYSLHEPYWNECFGCGYTTTQQQMLYTQIKAIADVPIYSSIGEIAYYAQYAEDNNVDTLFADGICDYCDTFYYPFKDGDVYERDEVIDYLNAELAIASEHAPNSKIIWVMQVFAQKQGYNLRMPTADEIEDLAEIAYATDIYGISWYTWTFDDDYYDFLENHPELFSVIGDIYEEYVLSEKIYIPLVIYQSAMTCNLH